MALPFKEHPLRYQGVAELHARTYEPLQAPARVSHIATICGEKGSGRNLKHLFKLLEHYGVPQPEMVEQHYFAMLGDIQMRWERHTEFVTYTFSKQGEYDHPFDSTVLSELPEDWLRELPGEVVTVVALALDAPTMPERSTEELSTLFAGNALIGSEVVGGIARAWSDLRIDVDGVSRILLRDQGLSSNQAGRLVKRFLEINAYRAMAILGLPEAREVNLCLSNADRRLVNVAARMTDAELGRGVPDAELLAELTALAAEIEAVAARTSSRFEASRAYYGVVVQRLDQLRQRRIEGLQTFTEFLDARLAPAIATCNSTSKRQQDLAERAARLTSLLRARVEVRLQEQNRSLLESMDRRAQLQLRLQETVEGLSVIAIGYYGVGLVGYLLKGLEAHGWLIHATYVTGLAAPLIVLVAWLGIRRMKERLLENEDATEN
ncbi:DUF3422 family protein [Chromatium okenii]|uniref:DUF3422 domain-containing protein n=1 Tax=Chromatium okenii TaxID=61644 RepID=A0A2S7XQJ8_9GAMM|nr:DUF3422 domain-containing protein [Chromatium okenii]MBV5310452.1 DUF3422 domain-containing protein [Chromatium okenii]PQJ96024.1 DUF3422 domain-containing protein [Chromatium okenii]